MGRVCGVCRGLKRPERVGVAQWHRRENPYTVPAGLSSGVPNGTREGITCLPSVETLGLDVLSPSGTGVASGT